MSQEYLSINVQNNTNGVIPVSLFGNYADLTDNSNQTREFKYDLTSLVFSTQNQVSVDYKVNSAASFTTFTSPLLTLSFQGVVDALNQLGIGSFFYYTSGGNTYVSNYNDDYEFGDINISDTSLLSSNISTYYNMLGVLGSNTIDLNGTTIWSAPNPVSFTGAFTANNADSIHVYGVASENGVTLKVTNTTLSVVLTNQTIVPNLAYTYTFTPINSNAYLIEVYE